MRSPQLPALVFIVAVSCAALSQESIPAVGTVGADSPATLTSSTSAAGLPADRIIELLREKPELLIELKKVAAERLRANGVDIQEDSISDEMLFQRIASDSGLRANLTL